MIDKISEFFNSLKERLSNPLIFSFIISWLFWNWPITIALLYSDTVKDTGYRSIYDLVNCHLGFWLSIVLPLFSAALYTFGFPYLRNKISVFQAMMSRKENDDVLVHLRGGKISMEKYLQITETYEKRSEDLEKIIAKVDSGNERVIELETNLIELRKEKSNYVEQIAEATTFKGQLNNQKIIEGDWRCIYEGKEVNIRIEGQNIYEIGKFRERLEPRSFIRSFVYDNRYRRLQFVRIFEKNNDFRFYDLEYEHNAFSGTENISTKVQFERPSESFGFDTNNDARIHDELGTSFNTIFTLGILGTHVFVYDSGISKHKFAFKLLKHLSNGKFRFEVSYDKSLYSYDIDNDFNEMKQVLDDLIFSENIRNVHRVDDRPAPEN